METWDYSIPGETKDGNEPFLNWLFDLDEECTFSVCPFVYSLSYGDYENTVSRDYAEVLLSSFVCDSFIFTLYFLVRRLIFSSKLSP